MTTPLALTEVPGAKLYCADALDVLRSLPDSSIDLIATDPPYFRVKGLAWDRAWDNADGFIAWIGQLADEWRRVLKPNGSLYCFASPKMAARVEVEIGKRFNVLTRITWRKPPYSTKAEMFRKADLRAFFPASEGIIFAEHYGADNAAKGESGYGAECDRLRGFVFEPLRTYIANECKNAGMGRRELVAAWMAKNGNKSEMPRHWIETKQFELPTPENYEWLRSVCNGEHLRREYEHLRREYEDLRREYEDLRLEYETLRRPFSVTADVPYTDVWDFKTVPHKPGKHVCEKPLDLCEHIILASSRPGAVVLDSFCGSGAFGHAAVKHGRTFIASDNDPHWIAKSAARIAAIATPPPQASLFPDAVQKTAAPAPQQRGLFLPESAAQWL
jgi:site-specific DNA-methyltransferase (adenine-specific)